MARQTWKLASEKAICQHGGDNTTHVVEWEPNKSQKIQHVKDTTSSFCFIVKRMSGKQLGSFSYICARYGVHSQHQKCREHKDGQQRLHQFLIASLRNMLCVCLCSSVFWGVQCEQSFTDLA
jgi:hypothetical protein